MKGGRRIVPKDEAKKIACVLAEIGSGLCARGRRALEGGNEERRFGSAAERKDRKHRLQRERCNEADEEYGEEREPIGLVGVLTGVGNEERDEGYEDRGDCDPEPGARWMKCLHLRWSEYSNKQRSEIREQGIGNREQGIEIRSEEDFKLRILWNAGESFDAEGIHGGEE